MCIPENNLYICNAAVDFIWLFSNSRHSKTFSRQYVLTIYRDKNQLMTNSKVQAFNKSNESLEMIGKGIVDFEWRWNVFIEVYAQTNGCEGWRNSSRASVAFATPGVRLGHLRPPFGLEGRKAARCNQYLHSTAASTEKLLKVTYTSL